MIQRLIYTAMANGLAAIKSDPTVLDLIFGEDGFGFTETEMENIRTLFNDENCPILHHGYPRVDSTFPSYFLILANEDETDHVLGGMMGMEDDPTDPNFGVDVVGTIWTRRFNLLCYSEHPDLTLYMYEIAKYIMQFNRVVNDVAVWTEMGGGDFLPDLQMLPLHVFGRVLRLMVRDDHFYLNRESRLAKAFTVGGIHVPDDSDGVITNITIGGEDDA